MVFMRLPWVIDTLPDPQTFRLKDFFQLPPTSSKLFPNFSHSTDAVADIQC